MHGHISICVTTLCHDDTSTNACIAKQMIKLTFLQAANLSKSFIFLSILFGGKEICAFAPHAGSNNGVKVAHRVCYGVKCNFAPTKNNKFSSAHEFDELSSSIKSSATAPSSPAKPAIIKSVASASAFIVMDVALRRLFARAKISFPSSLAGCGILVALLSLANKLTGSDQMKDALGPGAAMLAKWSAVFFVPSLVLLPLAEPLSAVEVLKVGTVVLAGFMGTLLTTAWSISAVRSLMGSVTSDAAPTDAASATPSNPFSDRTFNLVASLAAAFGVATPILIKAGNTLKNPVQSAFLLFITLTSFLTGFRVQAKFKHHKVVHPLVQCTILTWGGAKLMGVLTGATFIDMLAGYKTGSLSLMGFGAGDILLFLLGPTVVSFGWQMYNRSKLIQENIKEVGTAAVTSSVGGLFGTAAAVRLLSIAKPSIRLALISRNITSPLAIAIASILGADVSYAVTMVVISGLIGANSGASILSKFNVNDPVARGLSIGAAAHGLGTAAFVNEKEAFPFSAVSMALTASLSTVLVSIPVIRTALIKIALGA